MQITLSMREGSGGLISREKGKKQIGGRPETLMGSDSPYLPWAVGWNSGISYIVLHRVAEQHKRKSNRRSLDKMLCLSM